MSRLDLDIQNKTIKDFRFRLIPIFADWITPDAEMAAKIAEVRKPYAAELSRVLGRSSGLLYRRGNIAGTLDDLYCNAMLVERDAEISLSPGIRWGNSILPGQDITFEDVTNGCAVSYPNCYRTKMTGERLKEILEDVADNLFNPDPFYQQGGDMVRTGGLGFTLDITAGVGRRILNMTHLKSGKPIDATREYVVAGWASVNEGTEGPPIWQVVEKHLANVKNVDIKPNDAVKLVGA